LSHSSPGQIGSGVGRGGRLFPAPASVFATRGVPVLLAVRPHGSGDACLVGAAGKHHHRCRPSRQGATACVDRDADEVGLALDEPDWKDVLRVVPIELDERSVSAN
jgi:hypothetical protein